MIKIKKGNIFTTQCKTIVNTINCVGVMGAGIAYEYRLRYPKMFTKYKKYCSDGAITIGKLWIYDLEVEDVNTPYKKILNFPTKNHWKYPTKNEYLEKGLQKFLDTYIDKSIESIAFPLLGADKGGLDEKISFEIMESYLSKCQIPVEIWYFDSKAKDDLYDRCKTEFMEKSNSTLISQSGLRADTISKIRNALLREDVNSLSGLQRIGGIGEKSMEKVFELLKYV